MYRRLAAVVGGCALAAATIAPPSVASTLSMVRGGWCWFGDPRAIMRGDNVYFGWITGAEGNVEVGRFNIATGGYAQGRLRTSLPTDDHSNPALTTLPDGRVVAFYSPHSGRRPLPNHLRSRLWYRISKKVGGVVDWGREHAIPTNTPGRLGFTYPAPVWSTHRLYVFWRGGDWQPAYLTTTAGLKRWTRAQMLFRGVPHERPYVKYDRYGDGIRFAYVGAHPTRQPTSLYFGELRGWAVRRADGTPFRSRHHLPFTYTRGERIYSWRTDGRAWVWDIAHDGEGVTLDHANPDVVYLSRETPRSHFELFRWETHDQGRTWLGRSLSRARARARTCVRSSRSGRRAIACCFGSGAGMSTGRTSATCT